MASIFLAILVALAARASAQSTTSSPPVPTLTSSATGSYTTIFEYDSCTSTAATVVTVTNGVTVTYCPLCPGESATFHPPAASVTTTTTVFTTVCDAFCSTGLCPTTYTVTDVCTASPTCSFGPSYVAPGFTQTVTVCTVCGPVPITATLTVPCSDGSTASPPYPTGSRASCPGGAQCPPPMIPSTDVYPTASGLSPFTGAAGVRPVAREARGLIAVLSGGFALGVLSVCFDVLILFFFPV